MPDLQAQATALRADGHKLRAYVTFFKGQTVAEFEPDDNYTDSEYPLTAITGAYSSGSESDVGEGFLVEIRRSTGELREVTRTRYGATQTSNTLHIRELSRATSVTGSPDVLVIRREVRLSDKLVTATEDFDPDGIPVGTFNLNPPPIANTGGAWAGKVDAGQDFASVPMFGSLSYPVDPTSVFADLEFLWILPTGCAFQAGSSDTDADPVLECDVNKRGWLIELQVTDTNNGQVTTTYVMVIVCDDNDNAPYECLIEPIEGGKEDGWGYRVQVFEDATETDIPYGSYAFVWVDETINGSTQSFGSPVTGRSHIKAVGIIRREETREDATTDSLTFEIISPLARLGELAGFSKVMIREASPDAWSEINTLKTQRAILQLVMFYTNFNNAGFDIIIDDDVPDYDYPLLFLQKDSPLGQIRELAAATQSRFICDRRGRFELQPILNLLTRTARDNRDTQFVFSRDDIIDIQVSQEHWRPIETFRLKGFTAHTSDPQPIFAKYPGDAPGVGNLSGSMERIICQNTAQAYFFCGLYGAMEDGWFVNSQGIGRFAPRVTITVPGSYDVLDFYGEWIEFDFSLRLRELDLSAFRYELVRSTVTYDGGTAQCVLELQAETFGEPGVDDTPPASDTSGLTDWSDIWGTITFDPLLGYPGLGNARIAAIFANGRIAVTTNFNTASPNYTVYDLSGTIGTNCLQWCYDARSSQGNARGWIVTTTAIYYVTGIGSGSTPSATLQHSFGGSNSFRNIDASWAWSKGLFVVVVTHANPASVIASQDGGNTWGSPVTLTEFPFNQTPGLMVSPHTPGKVYTSTFNSATDNLIARVRMSTNYAATFSAQNNIQDEDGRHAGFVMSIASAQYAYHGSFASVGDGGVSSVNTNNLFRAQLDNVGYVDITPIVSATRYGPDWTRSRAAIAVSPADANYVLLCGTDEAASARGVFLITNGTTATGTGDVAFTQVVAPSGSVNYRRCALADNSTLFLFGTNDAIAYSANGGATVDDKIGDLSVSSEIIGITGF